MEFIGELLFRAVMAPVAILAVAMYGARQSRGYVRQPNGARWYL